VVDKERFVLRLSFFSVLTIAVFTHVLAQQSRVEKPPIAPNHKWPIIFEISPTSHMFLGKARNSTEIALSCYFIPYCSGL
jgi:hypothetical protein